MRALVLEGCTIRGVKAVRDSILGRHVEVRHSGAAGVYCIIAGDQSQIEDD